MSHLLIKFSKTLATLRYFYQKISLGGSLSQGDKYNLSDDKSDLSHPRNRKINHPERWNWCFLKLANIKFQNAQIEYSGAKIGALQTENSSAVII